MCGIAGVYATQGRGGKVAVERMLATIGHRGPDGTAVSAEGPATLGHHRLSILDLSDAAAQPMVDRSERYVLTFNGEIFNYVELREELEAEGVAFRTTGDAEVLLEAYALWGEECLHRFNGMFAFGIYDRRARALFCARDRLGVKPLVYSWDGARFAFASEHKALRAGASHDGVDADAIYEYIARGYTTGGRSFYEGIAALEPGHALRVDETGLRAWRWWTPSTEPTEGYHFEDWAEEIGVLLDDAVRIRLRSDVPVGAHLSGGLDSSAVVAAASRHVSGLISFTGAFLDDPASDERRYSRLVNDRFGIVGREVELRVEELADSFDRLLWHLDEPIAGPGAFPQLRVCDLAAETGVKVVLGGQGGDELFGGYLRHRVVFYREVLRRGSFEERAIAGSELALLASREWRRVRRTATRVPDRCLDPRFLAAVDPDFREHVRRPPLAASDVSELMQWDLLNYLPALLQVEDRTSMAASIESRTPLLDYRLVELALRIPARFRFRPGTQKPLLRAAVHGSLPAEVLERKDKRGFPTPLHHWRGRPPLRALVERVLALPPSGERQIPVFTESYLQRRSKFAPSELWTALMVQGWLNTLVSDEHTALAA